MQLKPPYGTPLDWENPINDGTVMHLAMNAGHGDEVQDLSVNGNNGTLHNFAFPPIGASGWNPGRDGVGLTFDGSSDYIDCGNDSSFDITDAITISLWMKFDTTSHGYCGIIEKAAWGAYMIFTHTDDRISFRLGAGSDTTPVSSNFGTTDWKFVTATYDKDAGANNQKLYIDGVVDKQKTTTGTMEVNVDDVIIGLRGASYFDGSISDVRIHNRALSAKEVLDYYINPQQVYLNYDKIPPRINNRFTTPYNTEHGSNFDKLSQVVAWHAVELDNNTNDIIAAHQLTEATGYSLDQWGNLFQVMRNTAETDAHYRARLITHLLIYRRSATAQDMVSTCAGVLGVGTDRISLTDSATPASFNMNVYLSDVVDSGLTLSDFSDIMEAARAAGVDLSMFSTGSFECKAIAGGHDADKAYNNIADANPDGGRYAGIIG